jgi:hypothetical protein
MFTRWMSPVTFGSKDETDRISDFTIMQWKIMSKGKDYEGEKKRAATAQR